MGTEGPLVWDHRTVSGAPPDSVRCTRGLQVELVTFGKIQRRLRYNSPDCPVLQRTAPQELASFGNSQRLVRYNSPDMSGIHRTVRCAIEATDTSATTATCSALNALAGDRWSRSSRCPAVTPDSPVNYSGVASGISQR